MIKSQHSYQITKESRFLTTSLIPIRKVRLFLKQKSLLQILSGLQKPLTPNLDAKLSPILRLKKEKVLDKSDRKLTSSVIISYY